MKTKKETEEIINILRKCYPDCKCSLDFKTPYQMMVAVMLSAQCTDERVNIVTKDMFKKYPTPEKMSKLTIPEIEKMIHSCGFYKNKAKSLHGLTRKLLDEYDGVVPETMKELETFPGIGRKCANVIMLEAFHNPQGIAVDTHAKRISNRIGLSDKKDPEQIEKDLLKRVKKEDYFDANHLFVWHGRKTCDARKPDCSNCKVNKYCNYYKKLNKE